MPAFEVVDQAQGFGGAFRGVRLAGTLIVETQHVPTTKGLLEQGKVGLRGRFDICRGREPALQSRDAIMVFARQDASYFQQRGIHARFRPSVGPLSNQEPAHDEGAGFLGREVHGWQMVTLHQHVAHPGLGNDRNAGLSQGGEIAIDRANAQFELRSQFFRGHDAPGLQDEDEGQQAVDAIHESEI